MTTILNADSDSLPLPPAKEASHAKYVEGMREYVYYVIAEDLLRGRWSTMINGGVLDYFGPFATREEEQDLEQYLDKYRADAKAYFLAIE